MIAIATIFSKQLRWIWSLQMWNRLILKECSVILIYQKNQYIHERRLENNIMKKQRDHKIYLKNRMFKVPLK